MDTESGVIMSATPRQATRWWSLAAVALATFVTSLDNTVVNVALPSIQRDLRLSIAGLEWVASAYILVFASLLLAGGRLADRYGRRRLFVIGLALFTGASLLAGLAGTGPALTYALIAGHEAGWTSPTVAGSLTLAAIAGAAFAGIEARARAPMVDVSLFRGRVFTGGTAAMMLWGLAVMGVYFFTSLYLQGVLGFSPTTAGAAFVPLALLMAAAAPLASALTPRIGANRTVAAGFVLVAAGLLAVARLGEGIGLADLMPGFALVGVGSGLTTPLTASILGVLPADRAGVASGILNAAREVSALLGVTVIGAILTTRQATALGHGATPTRAFLAGYTPGLVAAAVLMLAGAVLTLHVLDRRKAASRSQPAPIPAEPVPATSLPATRALPEPVG